MKEEFPWATVCMVILLLIAAVVGGAVVIWGDNGALSFEQYLNDLGRFAIGLGLLGIGRGVSSRMKYRR